MCGFMVCSNAETERSLFDEGFKRIEYRGPDDSRVLHDTIGIWGFHRLAIMGLDDRGMQPFMRDGYRVVCNGELYGFRKEKRILEEKGYHFISESDCEIIIPMYETYGTDMFQRLDAEFSLVLWDDKKKCIVAARDPIGIRPMFYGYDRITKGICFASEAKALVSLCDEVHPFPVGHYFYDGEFVCYHDATKFQVPIIDSLDLACAGIHELLIDGVEKRLDADAPIGFLLSGGLDSSLVCSIAQKDLSVPIRTFAIGMNKDAIDLKYARQVADYIGSNHTEVIITKDDVINSLREVIRVLETWDITTIRASMGMYLLCKYIKEHTDVKVLFTGEISDELFGYKYTDFAPDADSFQKESEKRIRELYMYDVLRADRCISSNGIEGRVPFGDLKFVEHVMAISPELKMNTYHMGKYLLRHSFEGDYLPENILYRDKAAFSDAVGHSLVEDLKSYAEEVYSDEEFEIARQKYTYRMPYTKESLLYREIFEEFYPGHADWICDYWLPNQAWEGCKVSDPSARVLSNYGKSGE